MKVQIPVSIKKMERSCEDVSQVLKSLAHPRRLLVLGHLSNGDKTVNELVDLCDVSQSQMSHFLMRLSYEGLVKCEKNGRYRVYSIADKRLKKLLETIQKEYCVG
ncbi:MAG: helix-turn-helix transcriptional regulator [Bdellovibrionaceae bacterium]|nr:helix-turn-helix transcriptional regulator [Pseudobdellovibrionaceae bacterium]